MVVFTRSLDDNVVSLAKELQAKLFSKKYRGKTMANRQIATSIASIISGGVTGYVLSSFEAPMNYAYLFMLSSFIMGFGFLAFSTMDEPKKRKFLKKREVLKSL